MTTNHKQEKWQSVAVIWKLEMFEARKRVKKHVLLLTKNNWELFSFQICSHVDFMVQSVVDDTFGKKKNRVIYIIKHSVPWLYRHYLICHPHLSLSSFQCPYFQKSCSLYVNFSLMVSLFPPMHITKYSLEQKASV